MTSRKYTVVLAALALSNIFLSLESVAQDPDRKDLGAVTCRDVLLASGEDRVL